MLNSLLKYKLLVAFCMAASFGLKAQSFLSLDQALSIGLRQNFQLIIDSNNVEASAINNSPGNAGFLPQLSLDGSVNYTGSNIKQKYSDGSEIEHNNTRGHTENASANLTWVLFDGGRMFATAKYLRLQEEQARNVSKDDVQNLLAGVINAYYNVVQQKQLLSQIDSSLKYYDVQLITAKNLQSNGKGTRQEVLQAQIVRNNQQSIYYGQQNALLDAKTTLNRLIQRNPDIDFEVADSIPVQPSIFIDTTELFLKQHNPLLMQALRNVDIQNSVLNQNRSYYYPQLSFTGGYGFNNNSSSASFFLQNQNLGWNAGLTLSYPIFNGFRVRNAVDISKINVRNAELQYKQTMSDIHAGLSTAYHKYKASLQQMTLLRENLELARENLQIALAQYKLFAITQIELQLALKSYDDAGAAYFASVYAVKTAETNLLLLNGSLVQ